MPNTPQAPVAQPISLQSPLSTEPAADVAVRLKAAYTRFLAALPASN